MKKIGITGGIGSGKTTLCKVAESMYIPVFYTDDVSKGIIKNNYLVKHYIIKNFGNDSYFDDGTPNSKHLANILFNDDSEMELLSQQIKPILLERMYEWFYEQEKKNKVIVFVESAIMLNSDFSDTHLDSVVSVLADTDIRVDRVLKRDTHRTREDVLNILTKQLSNEEMIDRSSLSVYNNNCTESDLKNIIDELKSVFIYNIGSLEDRRFDYIIKNKDNIRKVDTQEDFVNDITAIIQREDYATAMEIIKKKYSIIKMK